MFLVGDCAIDGCGRPACREVVVAWWEEPDDDSYVLVVCDRHYWEFDAPTRARLEGEG